MMWKTNTCFMIFVNVMKINGTFIPFHHTHIYVCVSYSIKECLWALLVVFSRSFAYGSLRVLLQVFGVSSGRLLLHIFWFLLGGCCSARESESGGHF